MSERDEWKTIQRAQRKLRGRAGVTPDGVPYVDWQPCRSVTRGDCEMRGHARLVLNHCRIDAGGHVRLSLAPGETWRIVRRCNPVVRLRKMHGIVGNFGGIDPPDAGACAEASR